MITIVKIGGHVIDDEQALAAFLDDFAALPSKKILVHGGGKLASRLCEQLHIPITMIDGRRVTDRATLDVAIMTYGGLINKRIVAMLNARQCRAIGLSGADANVMQATKRPVGAIDYGWVGDITPLNVDSNTLLGLLNLGLTPIVCALTHDGHGNMLNTNADSIASALACALATLTPVNLVYCFEKDGVLSDVNDTSSVIGTITRPDYERLASQGAVARGMKPKLDEAFKARESGVVSVIIKNANALVKAGGTRID